MKPLFTLPMIFLTALLTLLSSFCFAQSLQDDNSGRDDTQVFHVDGSIDLVSTLKIQYGTKPTTFVKSIYPRLEADSNEENESVLHFNTAIRDFIQQEISIFQSSVHQEEKSAHQLPKTLNKNNLYIDYDSAVTTANGEHLISIRFSIQSFLAGMAHPSQHYSVFNFNLDTNEILSLDSLFIANSQYLKIMADYVTGILLRRPLDKQMIMAGAAPTIENYKNWNIKPNGLLITFEEGQVAPRINGAITVLIPYPILAKFINPESPLANCTKSKKQCIRKKLLTGGFIDEAFYRPHGAFHPAPTKS